jgi:hypothetical protein
MTLPVTGSSVVVEAVWYTSEGLGFESRLYNCISSVYLILLTALSSSSSSLARQPFVSPGLPHGFLNNLTFRV